MSSPSYDRADGVGNAGGVDNEPEDHVGQVNKENGLGKESIRMNSAIVVSEDGHRRD